MKKKSLIKRRAVNDLSEEDVLSLWGIFEETYDGVFEEEFRSDLAEKDRVITLHDRDSDKILGFSTVVFSNQQVGKKRAWVLFSGDTALRPEAWGDRSMMTGFLRELIRFRLLHPFSPFYWLLISKGFKTYLLLARNFHVYWPRHDRKTPQPMRHLIETIVKARFPEVEEKSDSIFVLPPGHGRVKAGIAPLTKDLLRFADVNFFAEVNPHHAEGTELCCVGLVTWRMILASLLKVARRQRSQSTLGAKQTSLTRRPVERHEVNNA